jgi:hypothetical protein
MSQKSWQFPPWSLCTAFSRRNAIVLIVPTGMQCLFQDCGIDAIAAVATLNNPARRCIPADVFKANCCTTQLM